MVVLAAVLPGVMTITGETPVLQGVVGSGRRLLMSALSLVALSLKAVLSLPLLRLPRPLGVHPSSGLLATRLTSDGASEQMDMRATVASCRPLRLLGRRPLFFTTPSSSSSIKLRFMAPFSASPPASSKERSDELLLERIPESDESFLSRLISVRKPGLGRGPACWELEREASL